MDQYFDHTPTSIPGLAYRIDGTASHTDGFRDLNGSDYEIRPDVVWNVNNHTVEFSLDARQLNNTPDSYGIIYFNGSPLKSVPIDTRYTWPFNHVDQNYIRPTVTDTWWINDVLTINNRLSYLYRDFGTMRTGDSTSTHVHQNAVITNDPSDNNAFPGHHPQSVPAYLANLWSTYRFSIGGVPGFIAGAGLNYRDKNYSDSTNLNSIPAFVIGNALFGYEADNWGISRNVKNFTNQRYYMQANAAGATVGVSLSAFLKIYIKQ